MYFLRPGREVEPFIYNQRRMFPASMIKLFVMAKTMQDVHDGKLSLDEKITIKKNDAVGGAGVTTWYNAGQKEDFVLVVLSNGKAGRSDAIEKMQNLARYYAGTLQE